MHIRACNQRRPLKPDESREPTGFVIFFGGGDHVIPDRLIVFRTGRVISKHLLVHLALRECANQIERRVDRFLPAGVEPHRPALPLLVLRYER